MILLKFIFQNHRSSYRGRIPVKHKNLDQFTLRKSMFNLRYNKPNFGQLI